MKPLEHTGDSANIAYYAERGRPRRYVWVEVLHVIGDWHRPRSQAPTFHLTIGQDRVGEIAELTYAPRTRPRPWTGRLPERTVTQLVHSALKDRQPARVRP